MPIFGRDPEKRKQRAKKRYDKSVSKIDAREKKKAAINAMPGATSLERRLNYKGAKTAAKDKARRDNRAAVKKAKSVTPEQRKANQAKATSDHNKRVKEAIANHGGKKKTTTTTTKKKPHVSYKKAWDTNFKTSADGKTRTDQWGTSYDNTEDGFNKFKQKGIAWTNKQYFKNY